MVKTSLSQSSEFFGLNDDEIKRVVSVIERDFKLRQKEYSRIEELKKIIREEQEQMGYLAGSKEFNNERCIKCYKPFKIFFNPKEFCLQCQSNVCHQCATFNNQTKTWSCNICLKLKELGSLTAGWFYLETSKKHKRCGSAKVVRELYKHDKELSEIDEDLGYETVRKSFSTDSPDSGSVVSYVVHDKNLQNELKEYSKRLNFLIDNLQSDLSTRNIRREDLKDHQQQIASEIGRARTALSGPLRRANKTTTLSYEIDLQNLLIHKTEEILQMNLQEFQKSLITSNFDRKLSQIIFDKYVKKEVPPKLQRQSSIPSTRNNFPSVAWEMKSHNDTFPKIDLSRTSTLDEEDTEIEEEVESQKITPTSSTTEDHNLRFIETDLETIKKSAERVADWKINSTLVESKIVPLDEDEQERYTTWL